MAVWHAYLDESYNKHVFCVGGFLAFEAMWQEIAEQWKARLQFENEKSAIAGFPPISRYHASDCANLKSEFSENRGWDIPRQIKLTKRLCSIIGSEGPAGIVIGGRISDMKRFLGAARDCPKKSLYDLSFRMTLLMIVSVIRERFPATKVQVTIDQGKNFEAVARHGFEIMSQDETVPYLRDCFTKELATEESKRCVRLQAADFMAYEAMRQLEKIRSGRDDVRKSLQALIGTDIPLHIAQFTEENFADIRKMIENRNAGRPLDQGVGSALALPVTSGHRLSKLP